jgi:hypothetical protein
MMIIVVHGTTDWLQQGGGMAEPSNDYLGGRYMAPGVILLDRIGDIRY